LATIKDAHPIDGVTKAYVTGVFVTSNGSIVSAGVVRGWVVAAGRR
jgi:hypothetical protein